MKPEILKEGIKMRMESGKIVLDGHASFMRPSLSVSQAFNFLKGEPNLQAIKFNFNLMCFQLSVNKKKWFVWTKIPDLIRRLWVELERRL